MLVRGTAFGFAGLGGFPGVDTLAGNALVWNETVPRPSAALAGGRPRARSRLIVASGRYVVHREHRA